MTFEELIPPLRLPIFASKRMNELNTYTCLETLLSLTLYVCYQISILSRTRRRISTSSSICHELVAAPSAVFSVFLSQLYHISLICCKREIRCKGEICCKGEVNYTFQVEENSSRYPKAISTFNDLSLNIGSTLITERVHAMLYGRQTLNLVGLTFAPVDK